jgi:CO/xanthine dehydrogenase FAD-binding subunit
MVTFYRRLPKFDYIKPKGIDEVLNLLASGSNGRYMVYAGGTDLIPRIKERIISRPEAIIDLKGIPGMDYIKYDDQEGLRLGPLATIRSVATSSIVREKCPIFGQAASSIASTQVQNRGTIAGNICSAVPSADSAPALLCLEARLSCISSEGERDIGIEEFFKGPMETALNSSEILREIKIPSVSNGLQGVYTKLSTRSRMDLAIVGVAVMAASHEGVITDIRIGLGAVAPTPIIKKAAIEASEESSPIDDHRASAEYRKMMVEVLVRRGIKQNLSGRETA